MNLMRTTRAWGDRHKKTRLAILISVGLVIGLFGPFVLREDADASPSYGFAPAGGRATQTQERGPACRTAHPRAHATMVENECPNRPKKDPDSLRETKRQIKHSKWNAARKKASFFKNATKKQMRKIERKWKRANARYEARVIARGDIPARQFGTWKKWRNATTCLNTIAAKQMGWRFRPRFCTDDYGSNVPPQSAWQQFLGQVDQLWMGCDRAIVEGVVAGGVSGAFLGPGVVAGAGVGGASTSTACVAGNAWDQIKP